jgi:hypothetical protein
MGSLMDVGILSLFAGLAFVEKKKETESGSS